MKRAKAFAVALMMLVSSVCMYGNSIVTSAEEQLLDGTYVIRNVNSQICLDVTGGSSANGTNVQQWGVSQAQNYNTWRLESTGNGYYRIYSMLEGGDTCLLNTGNGTDSSDANVCIYENTGADNQLYSVVANKDGSFRIICKATGKAVEVVNAYTNSGANVQQWEVNGAACQNWELIPIDYVYRSELTETECTTDADDDFTPGDLNEDGIVNICDTAISKRLLVNNNATDSQKIIGNVSGDSSFTSTDLEVMQSFVLTRTGDFVKQYVSGMRTYAGIAGEYTDGVSETTNTGFVTQGGYLNLHNAADITSSWYVSTGADGVYAVTVRYANGGKADRTIAVTVNNEIVYWTLSGTMTGAWTTWAEETIYLPLGSGVNKITFTSLTADGASNIDYITVDSTDRAQSPSTPIDPIVGVYTGGNNTYGEGRQMENLNRGVTAVYNGSGMLVSWRILATDSDDTYFKLYRNGNLVAEIAAGEPTNYFVSGATAADSFTVDTYSNGIMTEFANAAIVLGNKNSGQSGGYMEIALDPPAAQTMPDGTTCTYTPNDSSVGDVDGDGQYEIFVKWDPSNSKDNANDGYTGTVFIDCYRLDGTRLWRIDLGKNIRAGAHYTQFMVYDFDGDSKAEMMVKTADGTVDGVGKVIGSSSADYRSSAGRILSGPEYLTLFDGLTGAALHTINFEPARGTVSSWGDDYGNRCDRFLAGVAYLDGQTPSAIFARGYYARTAIVAYDVENKQIVKRWGYDTGTNSSDGAYNQGNHSLVVMDVDADGKDEIVYGSCCFDDDGTLKYSTGLGHGDCMQAGDLIPEREGLEIFQVHEHHYCAEIHDAATGEIIWKIDATGDVGRGIALNLVASSAGMEFTSTADSLVYAYNPSTGKVESQGYYWNDKIKWSMNSAIWYDGDLEREALDRTMVEDTVTGRLFTGDASYNNGSKSNACLTADIFGDWREELIFYTNGGSALRIFGTTHTTDVALFTLMHDSQYRTGVAIENVGYNQAPNTSFFLGTGYDLPEKPVIYTVTE